MAIFPNLVQTFFMKNIKLLLLFSFLINKTIAQDVTKISMNGLQNGTPIVASDFTFAGYANNNIDIIKAIGYTAYPFSSNSHLGLISINHDHSINYNYNYLVSNKSLHVAKITCDDWPTVDLYMLAGYRDNFSNKETPLILKINPTSGGVVWSKKLPVPNLNSFQSFSMRDIIYRDYLNKIYVLCEGYYSNPVPGSPETSIFVFELDLNSNNYTIKQLFNPNKLNTKFQQLGFIKNYHWSMQSYDQLSIYGMMENNSFVRGFIYTKDPLNNEQYKTYELNNVSTMGFQVNGYDALTPPQINFILQNQNYDFALSGLQVSSLNSSWQKFYSDPTMNFTTSNIGHGIKGSDFNNNDFFIGYHGSPFLPGSSNGYGYLRFNTVNGTINQQLWYNLMLNDFAPIHSIYDQGSNQSSFVSSGLTTSGTRPFFYLVERNLSSSTTTCTDDLRLEQENYILFTENETMTTITDPTTYPSETEAITAQSITTSTREICNDPSQRIIENSNPISNPFPLNDEKILFSKNHLQIHSHEKKIRQIELFSIDGKLIKRELLNDANTFSTNFKFQLNDGVYILKILFSNGSSKVVKLALPIPFNN